MATRPRFALVTTRVAQCFVYYYKNSTAVECPALAPIQNGNITYGPDMTADFDVDTVANHSCDTGFRLSGSDTRVCLVGGIWSDQPPEFLST